MFHKCRLMTNFLPWQATALTNCEFLYGNTTVCIAGGHDIEYITRDPQKVCWRGAVRTVLHKVRTPPCYCRTSSLEVAMQYILIVCWSGSPRISKGDDSNI
ncbi:hypothetical protein PF005_g18687 [Phytophthora fragariae]|uniref:Uncharacterized protein n=1 Tax=Phytophthora fragariae TaxID=53985 RepID=A0A6A3RRM3_9STRA|nr:hypothetical protein PF003_g34788 [Phytophthora fragariae]KAE8932644.1 hypothetical protein PF009_g17333 [Phytophthora fragariae]KAE8995171.1 hypothetical protein PF011_g16439 [Phytophthora fragariae]KAE9091140.1 hypothetical protein PF010_g18306 [Phytophthora fragariae]KAE9101795.1 hypothetical protein PF007_g14994 [Phytophthora fragariae]